MPKQGQSPGGKKDQSSIAKANPHLKFGKELNTKKFEFSVEDYFWNKKATQHSPKGVQAKARFRTP